MSLCFLSLETSKIFNQLILKELQNHKFEGLSEALILLFPFIDEYKNITISQLSKKVGYSRQAMHKNIKKLEEFEYIKLTKLNQKEIAVSLSPKGEEIMKVADKFIKNTENKLAQMIGKDELEAYKKTQIKLFEFLNTSN